MHHRLYWQAKIWGLLHDPAFKPLLTGKSGEGLWKNLAVMEDIKGNANLIDYLKKADHIASASDRAAIGNINNIHVNYGENSLEGLKLSHLLSGADLDWQISDRDRLINTESKLFPDWLRAETDPKKVFWWLWRCLPTAACKASTDENNTSLLLMPADTRIPDTSLWSHSSMTAALAGAMVGYDTTIESFNAIPQEKLWYNYHSHPHLVSFSFAPVQDLIKSSRKMRDFWAGSWILHYLSAKISWKLAGLYGADSLLYPSLFHQPLIDRWLLAEYPDFDTWIKKPSVESLLTAGFPNVIVMVLPEDKVNSAMQTTKQYLQSTWRDLGTKVFNDLQGWRRGLDIDASTWNGWLDAQWQVYWTGLPIGKKDKSFQQSVSPGKEKYFTDWVSEQNITYNLNTPKLASTVEKNNQKKSLGLFQPAELNLLTKYKPNIGSWWGYIFDANRIGLTSIKNARNWEIPTVFSTRSTISGLGAAVHDRSNDWCAEGEVKQFWQQHGGLFNGSEQLNATEVVKRGLHRVLPELLGLDKKDISIAYPDLSSGVAGYLRTNPEAVEYYLSSCEAIKQSIELDQFSEEDYKWGIPWAENDESLKKYHPRLLNAGWLVEDLEGVNTDDQRIAARNDLNTRIDIYYPSNNPTDWYVLAAGDGDGMSEWLKGIKLETYAEYVAPALRDNRNNPDLTEFLKVRKRMGPSTHNALSRALLDFSNQLVPYLTETRYAGRLIYGGGDDVLAYTNLWEWDSWLWDIRQCFKGSEDPSNEFTNNGDYWQWGEGKCPENITPRPLFTMGSKATISFGILIAHQSVPLAIALENLWAAEESAKEHRSKSKVQKDAVQVRVMYQNGNIASSTAKFDVFNSWRKLLKITKELELDAAIFEQAATVWQQHPAPTLDAIDPWCRAFCSRREALKNDIDRDRFRESLSKFIKHLLEHTQDKERDEEISNWLKLAAFIMRRREIKINDRV